ncbi:Mob1/phocein [Exidia glandulosa HHB12029]|uniref:Mob1/phocein n=1 Tax=Exidia glandulosa HHB12029 TaxID=1314781 RepID=A0A165CRQ7_EXIGL|nr:Mob1/phocein [Exidia glandulosa HHB12029]
MAAAAVARPQRGERFASFFPPVPEPVPSVFNIESAFQLQEYIALLIRHDVHDVDKIVSVPASVDDKTVDEACWIYEHLRRLAQDLTHPLITTLQQECTRQTCPEMKAGEWLYLCVAHGNGGTTEAYYILHTLDSATALLTSSKAFNSRINIPPASLRHFSSLARRLSRIFAHAYFHHREAFEQAEAETSLYARFLALSQKFDLVPAEFLLIPTPPPTVPALETGATDSGKGTSPGAESPNDALSPNSLSRLGRPRTDTMYFSGDFNFMAAAAAANGGSSPSSQTAAPAPPAVEPKAALHDLREPDRTDASLDIFHSGFEDGTSASAETTEDAPPEPPRANPVPLPEEGEGEGQPEAESDAGNPFADPIEPEQEQEQESYVTVKDFVDEKDELQDVDLTDAIAPPAEETPVEVPRGKSPLVEPKLEEESAPAEEEPAAAVEAAEDVPAETVEEHKETVEESGADADADKENAPVQEHEAAP